jgi:hypothetical protein
MITNIHATGLECLEPLTLLLGENHRFSHLDIDLLVLGPRARNRGQLLRRLRYRRNRRTPYAIISEELFCTGMLKVPYITYGYSPDAHVYPVDFSDELVRVSTPPGELTLELHWPLDDLLAAVSLGLALRLCPETLSQLLNPRRGLSQAA